MTEDTSSTGMSVVPTYEQIRDNIPHSGVREQWRAADAHVETMREQLERIAQDENLSDEGKEAAAQQVIDRHAGRVTELYKDCKEKATHSAEQAPMRSAYQCRAKRPSPPAGLRIPASR